MIEEQFVSFDTAKLLKEAGFREHCRCMYFPDKDGSHKICQNIIADYNVTDDEKYEAGDYYGYGDCYLAPTQALAARWLRETHNIHVFPFFEYARKKWCYGVSDTTAFCAEEGMDMPDECFLSCEEAFEVGLQYGLKLIKK